MQYHPDQNQENKGRSCLDILRSCHLKLCLYYLMIHGCENVTEAAEAKFKEVMDSYEAIQQERKNHSL